jgi:putative OPT family oligopeptide transporter
VLVIVFGFFFVTVASRIVGLIGTSSNPISGMTIATLMGTCLIFVGFGWTGDAYQPMALCVGSIVCIAAANAGATSQDLKTGFLVGATPRAQQIGLLIGVVTATVVVGLTIRLLDQPPHHLIGSDKYPAPQATLMATLIQGLLAFNLDWQFVLVGVTLAVTMELCGVKSLSFAVGAYLPLSTTAPVFAGGVVKAAIDHGARLRAAKNVAETPEEAELGPGNLFATGLVAGGAVAGVVVALLTVNDGVARALDRFSLEHALNGKLGPGGYQLLGLACFAVMAVTLFNVARNRRT